MMSEKESDSPCWRAYWEAEDIADCGMHHNDTVRYEIKHLYCTKSWQIVSI